jgi:hypothetical protein
LFVGTWDIDLVQYQHINLVVTERNGLDGIPQTRHCFILIDLDREGTLASGYNAE